MRCFDEMQTTENSRIYKRARKKYLEGRGINCSFCPYHRWENWKHKLQRSWKKFRKTKYKYADMV